MTPGLPTVKMNEENLSRYLWALHELIGSYGMSGSMEDGRFAEEQKQIDVEEAVHAAYSKIKRNRSRIDAKPIEEGQNGNELRKRQSLREAMEVVQSFGFLLATPTTSSAALKEAAMKLNQHGLLGSDGKRTMPSWFSRESLQAQNGSPTLTQLGLSSSGKGRRLRMELMAAGWLVAYFYGVRNDALLSGMLRLASNVKAVPTALAYAVAAGFYIDEERFRLTHHMHRGDIYYCRLQPGFLFGKTGMPTMSLERMLYHAGRRYQDLQLMLTVLAVQRLAIEDKRIADEVSGKEIELWDEKLGSSRVRILIQTPQGEETSLVSNRLKRWTDRGCEIRHLPKEAFAAMGRGFFGVNYGIAYYGPEPRMRTPDLSSYASYRLDGDDLRERRRAFKTAWDGI